ncbi:MAG: hypothetical protein KDK30_02645 [Leptospiraceae bacterium]|nr:hypothetical protein [Leptospiraceae bacterium]
MNNFYDTILPILILLILLGMLMALFIPILRNRFHSLLFYTSGSGKLNLRIRRRLIIENLRDLRIERDMQKLNEQEFQQLARPYLIQLRELEGAIAPEAASHTERASAAPSATVAGQIVDCNRLGWFCPDCGNLNRPSQSMFQGARENPPDGSNKSATVRTLTCLQCGGQHDVRLPAESPGVSDG